MDACFTPRNGTKVVKPSAKIVRAKSLPAKCFEKVICAKKVKVPVAKRSNAKSRSQSSAKPKLQTAKSFSDNL